jgi:hypothetical protein
VLCICGNPAHESNIRERADYQPWDGSLLGLSRPVVPAMAPSKSTATRALDEMQRQFLTEQSVLRGQQQKKQRYADVLALLQRLGFAGNSATKVTQGAMDAFLKANAEQLRILEEDPEELDMDAQIEAIAPLVGADDWKKKVKSNKRGIH